ncbi:MAG: amino acid ABC transporter permease [Candidatus Binatia bacterium]|nr:MAG: amino acid ABC transporter permease [Candidatus Binatia bacterium]
MIVRATLLLAFFLPLAAARPLSAETLVVGSKRFTESRILAEIMAQLVEAQLGIRVERRFNLAGTQIAFDALRHGEIDFYAEYTGTGLRNILGETSASGSREEVFARVSREFRERWGLVWLAPFGFDNTYVMVMRRDRARELGVRTLSDAARVPLRYGVSHEFLRRPDGMPGLRRVYGIREKSTVGMEHDLAYRALAEGAIDVADGYSTDAKIEAFDLFELSDDRGFFPPYEAAPLVRAETLARHPELAAVLSLLAGRIDAASMRRLNLAVEDGGKTAGAAAADFLSRLGLLEARPAARARPRSFLALLWERRFVTLELTARHLELTLLSVAAATLVAVPAGIFASRRPRVAALALGFAGALQTIPSIALLAFMLPLFGVGVRPALAALFLYGLLPILRNTITGLRSVDPELREVAVGLGMTRFDVLWRVELPLSARVLLAGIRTSTVINIGTATLAAFIGAGGLGDPIVTGLTMTDFQLVLSGALPAAALALLADGLLAGVERLATPRGLRITPG